MNIEKENTVRALKDEPLIMTSILCKFGIHTWTKYDEPIKLCRKYIVSFSSNKTGYYNMMCQEKRCVRCNIPSFRHYKQLSGD